jgi:hypothetical protein
MVEVQRSWLARADLIPCPSRCLCNIGRWLGHFQECLEHFTLTQNQPVFFYRKVLNYLLERFDGGLGFFGFPVMHCGFGTMDALTEFFLGQSACYSGQSDSQSGVHSYRVRNGRNFSNGNRPEHSSKMVNKKYNLGVF